MTEKETKQAKIISETLHNAQIIVEVCKRQHMPTLARACSLVERESAGRNIYSQGEGEPAALRGQTVTEANYQVAKETREKGGQKFGIGMVQITDTSLQVKAQDLGGCWKAKVSLRVGLELFHELVEQNKGDVEAAYGCYNGGGGWREVPAAVEYAKDKAAAAVEWEKRLRGAA